MWEPWGGWGTCSERCGGGTRARIGATPVVAALGPARGDSLLLAVARALPGAERSERDEL